MDPSSVLRSQSQNKIRTDFLRLKKEQNKMQVHPRPSKFQPTRHLSDENVENQDPGSSQMGKKAPLCPGVSRLPVLAKSLRLQTPVDFSQSHSKWEEKPLAGKAKNKRPCTRPIPFNLTQPKSSRVASENQHPLTLAQPRTGCDAVQPDNNACNGYLKSQSTNAKPTKHPSTLNRNLNSRKGTENSNFKNTEITQQLSGHPVPSITFKTSNTLSQPPAAVFNDASNQNNSTMLSAQSTYSTETCLDNMNLLSLKDPTNSSSSSHKMQLTTQGNFSKSSTEKGENFQTDHTALLSILRNEGVSVQGFGSATPQSKPFNCVPQRVSVMKTQQKVGATAGSVKSMQFSPDPAALRSILQNEGVKAEGPFGATPQHAARPSGRGTSVYTARRVPLKKNHAEGGPIEKGENFQTDHTALLSILRNEGVSIQGFGSATPQSKPFNCVPQRVSVMKTQQKVGATAGSVKSMQFSPDSAALRSILQNEGVKAEGPFGATPQHAARPSGRGTSVYTARRVPLKKNHAEGGPIAVALKETPFKKWTPQRVRDIRHQPMSAMRAPGSSHPSPYGSTPGLRSCKTNLDPHKEEVVQRLFDDQEDQQSVTVKDPETQAKQLPVQVTTSEHELKYKLLCEEKVETSRVGDFDHEEEKEQRKIGEQPFIQAPQRESVIFFSTGKKLLRDPRFEKKDTSAHQEQLGLVTSAQKKMLPVSEEEPTNHIALAVQSLEREVIVPKSCPKSPAVAMLRKRLPQLEELRLDEEVSTYTSTAVQTALGFLPPRPRCGNPLASILHFEELSTFVPISSGPSSPLQER